MREYLINFCGLNPKYMKKLALYFQKRLKDRAETGVWEEFPEPDELGKNREKCCCIWIGSEEAIAFLSEAYGCITDRKSFSEQKVFLILMTAERNRCGENSLYLYQSCDSIYREIFRCCHQLMENPGTAAATKSALILSFIGADIKGALLPYAMTCTQLLGINGKTLLINMVSYSGMQELFGLERADTDLADLFLAMREGESDIGLESFARHIGEADFIAPMDNPEILDEIGTDDMDRFLSLVRGADYDCLIFAFDGIRGWTRKVLEHSACTFCLTDPGILSQCRMHELQLYLEKAIPQEQICRISAESADIKEYGEHLLYNWLHDVPGNQIRALLNELHIH